VITASEEFSGIGKDLIVTGVGAVLGFLFAIILEQLKKRQESRKQLTWEATTQSADVALNEEVRRRTSITFDGVPVHSLTSIEFTLTNSGNTVVRDHQLRFEFPEGCRVLEAELHPAPEREMGAARRPEREENDHEAVFAIGHFEHGRTLRIRVVAAGADAGGWKPISHNSSGDVEFRERSAARTVEDSEHVPQFLILGLFMLTVPPLIPFLSQYYDYDLGEPLSALIRVAFLVALMPHLAPTCRVIRDALIKAQSNEKSTHLEVRGERNTVLHGDRIGDVTIRPDPQDDSGSPDSNPGSS
jgi:hypothetical protein